SHHLRLVRVVGAVLLAFTLLTACAGSSQPNPPSSGPPVGEAPSSSSAVAQGSPQPPEGEPPAGSSTTTPATPSTGTWRVGPRPLPLRPDGFGKVLAPPAALRDRRLPTRDRLPPPPGGRFRSWVRPGSAAVRARMGGTRKPGCPVPLGGPRYL